MFLKLNHQKLEIFSSSKMFVLQCYQLTQHLPQEEKFGMISQIRRATLSVHLNIAEGASRKSSIERKRFYEISRGSLIEVDAALDIAFELGYLKKMEEATIQTFKLISGLINSTQEK